MSEQSLENLIYYVDEPQDEVDTYQEDPEIRFKEGVYKSSKIEIIDSLGTEDFKFTWITLRDDITETPMKLQRIFSEQILDKISEVYDFTFPEKVSLDTEYEIKDFYNFLEFLEYKNFNFIKFVWKYLGPKNLIEIDLKSYCDKNYENIIKEIDEQLEVHPQTKLISLFLRSLYKEKIIDWFVKNSEQNKIEITVFLLENY